MNLETLLVVIIVLGLVFWLIQTLINAVPIAPPFKTAAMCVLIVIAIFVLLDFAGLTHSFNFHRCR